MKQFYEKVDLRSRKAMVDFLENHFRYNTMNSWNNSTSFANNMKVYNLGLPNEVQDILLDILYSDDMGDLRFYIDYLIEDFEHETNHRYTAGFNGRSGGYLVMYKMELVPSNYKSYCTHCYQINFTSVTETGKKCGKCGKDTRVDYIEPPMNKNVYPGKSIGEEDYEDKDYWDMSALKDEVRLVQLFDKLCDNIVAECNEYAKSHKVVEEEILVSKTVKKVIEVA